MKPVLPPLPTSVVGSYSMPEWLKRAKNDYLQRRVSRHDLDEMHDAVRKGAIKDQEVAGVDVLSDGELQRDNMIDYFAERLPGVQIDLGSKRFYYDYYDSAVRSKLATGSLGLVEDARILRRFTDRRTKVTISGFSELGSATCGLMCKDPSWPICSASPTTTSPLANVARTVAPMVEHRWP